MKTGDWYPVAINLICPYCREAQTYPRTGSYMLDAEAFLGFPLPSLWRCQACAELFQLPDVVANL